MSSLRQQSPFAHASCQSSARLSGKQCFAQGSEPRIAVRQPLARIAVLLSQEAVTRHTPMLYLHQHAGPLKEGLDTCVASCHLICHQFKTSYWRCRIPRLRFQRIGPKRWCNLAQVFSKSATNPLPRDLSASGPNHARAAYHTTSELLSPTAPHNL